MRDALLVAAATAPAAPGLAGRAALVAALLVAATLGWWVARRRTGTFRPVAAAPTAGRGDPGARSPAVTAADLHADLGERATFVQFSSSTCATCPQVSRMLSALADVEQGVVHIEVHAERSMDLVRHLGVFRTPTVLLVDTDGHVHSRTSGPITATQAQAALESLSRTTTPRPTETARSPHV